MDTIGFYNQTRRALHLEKAWKQPSTCKQLFSIGELINLTNTTDKLHTVAKACSMLDSHIERNAIKNFWTDIMKGWF